MIEFLNNSHLERMKNFQKVSQDFKKIENFHIECLTKIDDSSFEMAKIEECVGLNFKILLMDIKYEYFKVFSRGDATLR